MVAWKCELTPRRYEQHSTDEENNNENKEGNQFGEIFVDTQKIVVLSV